MEIALEESCRFFITSLGNPKWVVEAVKAANGFVYHDASGKEMGRKGIASRCGRHHLRQCTRRRPCRHLLSQKLYQDLADLNVPLVCAGE